MRDRIMIEPKKRGRPPKPVAERRRHNQTFRCNDEMLARLQAEADSNQRSLSEEVEKRIEESFLNKSVVDAMIEAQDAFAVQAIHSTLEELQADLGHTYSLAVAIHMGQGFTEAAKKIRAETPNEIWFDNPARMKEAADLMHKRVDDLFVNWGKITFFTSFWNLFQKYRENIFRKKADGTYARRSEEARKRREAEAAGQASIDEA